MIERDEALCPCGHTQDDHHFGCEALADEGCPCTAIYPADGSAPWTPPGLRLPRVGDRVVVRLSGECQVTPSPGSDQARRDPDSRGHADWQNRTTGRVVMIVSGLALREPYPAHVYGVRWDQQPPVGVGANGAVYAAIELEILADDDGG